MIRKKTLTILAVLLCAVAVQAEVTLPAILGSNMVLQRGTPARLWGWAAPGETVTVTAAEQNKTVTADATGAWRVTLDPLPEGKPLTIVFKASNTITLKNVLLGEVWICSGQSNMAMSLRNTAEAKTDIPAADHPEIRLFRVRRTVKHKPEKDCRGSWTPCTPESAATFSAAAYYFGRQIHLTQKVPVGLVQSAVGGTPAEAWTPRGVLAGDETLAPMLEEWRKKAEKWDPEKAKADYEKRLAKWKEKVAAAKEAGKKRPRKPRKSIAPLKHARHPAVLYNGMIAPLTPLRIRGAIWYQGEANGSRGVEYRTLFPAMIRAWREAWDQGDFPFLFVQLPNFNKPTAKPGPSRWAELREAQLRTLALPHTGMAVTIDIGMADNIHPKNKKDVGTRLALAARQTVYGETIVGRSPRYESMQVEGNAIRIRFRNTGDGLVAGDGQPLTQFAIAGEDRKFVWAKAEIDGDTVVVSNEKIEKPVAVRYAWAQNPEGCNLRNSAGLPASPFRTDDWPVGAGKKKAAKP